MGQARDYGKVSHLRRCPTYSGLDNVLLQNLGLNFVAPFKQVPHCIRNLVADSFFRNFPPTTTVLSLKIKKWNFLWNKDIYLYLSIIILESAIFNKFDLVCSFHFQCYQILCVFLKNSKKFPHGNIPTHNTTTNKSKLTGKQRKRNWNEDGRWQKPIPKRFIVW